MWKGLKIMDVFTNTITSGTLIHYNFTSFKEVRISRMESENEDIIYFSGPLGEIANGIRGTLEQYPKARIDPINVEDIAKCIIAVHLKEKR